MRSEHVEIKMLLWLLLFSLNASAQLAATKDLTDTAKRPAEAAKLSPQSPVTDGSEDTGRQDCFLGIRDGAIVRDIPERLQFEIVSADPRFVSDGTMMTITVRLKNLGDQPVLVPWETHEVQPDIDPKTGNTSYESATIHLTFGTLEDRKSYSYLKGEASLLAAPSNRDQHLELLPGQWLEVKFKTTVECASKETWSCKRFHTDKHAQLKANWWEWLYTHEEEGCSLWRGAYKSRTLETNPIEVVYVTTSPSARKQAEHH